MDARLLLLLVLGPSLVLGQNSTDEMDATDRQLRRISRQLATVKALVKNLGGSSLIQESCDVALGDISNKLSAINDKVAAIKRLGNVIERVDLGVEGHAFDSVIISVPPPIQECFDALEPSTPKTAGQVTCMQELFWTFEPRIPRALRNRDVRRLRRYRIRQGGLPRSSFRIRKEYRTLSRQEREDYHDAVRVLIQDGTLARFARVHQAAASAAHGGPAFLPWHRAFLTSYEEALRRVNPNVSLPYWDSSLDNEMTNPVDSMLWTDEYVGNGMGTVVIGPFTDIMTLQGPLEREYGERSRLIQRLSVADMMTNCHYRNISAPTAPRGHNLESFHNNVHVWVGADMSAVRTAAYDPVFYMHHCFIDYLWEEFREHQLEDCSVDPVVDYYEDIEEMEEHGPDDRMSGMPYYRNSLGAQAFWTQSIYSYEDSPTCENNCGNSETLYCNELINYCVPRSRFDPLPSTSTFMPPPPTTPGATMYTYGETTPHCDHMWPWCHQNMHLHRAPSFREGELAPASFTLEEDIKLKKLKVPRNRGMEFIAEPTDGRTFGTRIIDVMETAKVARDAILRALNNIEIPTFG